jgi:hypothetical protein
MAWRRQADPIRPGDTQNRLALPAPGGFVLCDASRISVKKTLRRVIIFATGKYP